LQEIEAQFVEMAGTLIKRQHLRYGEPPSLETLRITMAVDLAISTKTHSDYTAAVVLGRDEETGAVYVLDAKRIRADFQGVLAFIRAVAEAWQPREIGIENVQYQASVIQELRRITSLPIRAVKPEKDKITRFMPLQTRYEQGLVYHTERVSADFEKELLSFPEGQHDDMIDAAAYAFALQNKQQVRIFTFD
jgi:predicted phage terminase large subunit-like protein